VAPEAFNQEHARRLRFVRGAGFLGDGSAIHYSVVETADRRERNTLWIFDLEAEAARRLATDLADVLSPAASPDGRTIAVLAEVDGRHQVHLVSTKDGTAQAVTSLPQGAVGPLAWSPDGASIAFAARPGLPRDRSEPYWVDRITYRIDGLGNLDDAVTDLYVLDVASGEARQLTDDRWMNSAPVWSPDGRRLAYLASFPPDRPWQFLPELNVLDLEAGVSQSLLGDWGGAFAVAWYGDGSRLAFVGAPSGVGYFAKRRVDVWTIPAAGGEPQCRTGGVKAGVGMPLLHTDLPTTTELMSSRLCLDGEHAYASGPAGGAVDIYRLALTGPETVERLVDGEGSSYLCDFRAGRGVLRLTSSFTDPPELVLESQRLTGLNDGVLAAVAKPDVRRLEVAAPDGVRSEAWALTPPEKGPWPTVLCIHPGPWSAFGDVFSIDFHLLVGAGFAVVAHNYRGSAGYGEEFAQQISGDWGRLGSIDHHATIDAAIAAGVADPDRLGVFGVSNGGFATCWLLTTSDRFRAGVAENPLTSFESAYYLGDCEPWIADEFGVKPGEAPERYRGNSPLTHAGNCRTPLLLIVSESDLRISPANSDQMYRALRSTGTPTAMLRLPGTAHAGTSNGPVPARDAQSQALLDWFRTHM
jgi:dipeptidyl aminopeptidase/acylaminoacyl peptidase